MWGLSCFSQILPFIKINILKIRLKIWQYNWGTTKNLLVDIKRYFLLKSFNYLFFLFVLVCDERKCRRVPLTHYQSLQCTGVYERDNCCPVRYNCNHLYDRIGNRHNTCYINKNEYALGAKLREYDSTLCEEDCTCINKDGL